MERVLEHRDRSADASEALPEPLHQKWIALAIVDLVAAICAGAAVWEVLKHPRSTIIALAVVLAFAWTTGRYRRSFAVHPLDELYTTIALATEAAIVLIIVVPIFSAYAVPAFLTLLLWTAVAGFGTMQTCKQRRGDRPARLAESDRVDYSGRARARSSILQLQLRCADLLFGSIAAIVLSPLLAIVAVAVAIDSGRPVIFRQLRVGAGGQDFTMLKFRTMKSDAGDDWVTPGDARITRVGRFLRKTSLDELPQLWNVLAGEMSLVGPRPEMREYADRFAREASNYPDRHILSPGITGWAQLYCARNLQPSDMPEVLKHDLFYIQNAGLHLYFFCIVKTALELVTHKAV